MALTSRSQALVLAAVAVAVLLIGARALRGSEPVTPAMTSGGTSAVKVSRSSSSRRLAVHVAGEVRRPGVYELDQGSRVDDAVRRAGGATRDALTSGVNLAARLIDGQQVQMPARAPTAGGAGQAASGAGLAAAGSGPINIASATPEQLQQIDGIGEKTAAKILEFRQERGGIAAVEDLDAIPGIGPKTIEKLKEGASP